MRKCSLLLSSVLFRVVILAQTESGFQLLDSANRAHCEMRFDKSLKFLNRFQSENPDHGLSEEVSWAIAKIYSSEKNFAIAIPILKDLLIQKEKSQEEIRKNYYDGHRYQPKLGSICPDGGFQLIKSTIPRELKYRVCLELNEIYLNLQLFDSSLTYLNIAGNNFIPTYGGCANGIFMEMGTLAKMKAKVFLLKKDTLSAISEMLPFLFCQDTESKLEFTFDLLFEKFSKQVVKKAIQDAIETAEILTNEQGYKTPMLYVFGKKIELAGVSAKENPELKRILKLYLPVKKFLE